MFPWRAPKLLVVSIIALLGVAGQPLDRDACAAPRPALVVQHGGTGGAASHSTERAATLRIKGDPDDFTQTGGSEPTPIVPGSSTGRTIFGLFMDIVRAVGALIGPR